MLWLISPLGCTVGPEQEGGLWLSRFLTVLQAMGPLTNALIRAHAQLGLEHVLTFPAMVHCNLVKASALILHVDW